MTNQTVTKGLTTLQNLTYTFSNDQNNGQILSQTDAVSVETIVYTYDSLNRLLTAATTGPQWGLSFSYDGFGNRTNQTITKGNAPPHSVTVNPNNNQISSAGHVYDLNGNMTQIPQLTMGYDVANRMVSSNHTSAGTQTYGYNHANQRVFVRSGNTVTYYLYGLGGERLMEFQETCTGGACSGYTENQRWIYFAGRKMFSKTGSTLKAITPNRLASEAKHFPYGENDGPPPSDTKDNFATYRRDETGLDYAWNRYYSPTMGRFTTADPYGGSAVVALPETWNRYSYVGNNPVNRTDSTGLVWGFMPGSGSDWVECAMNPFGAMTDWFVCGQSPYSQEMWSIIGPWGGGYSEPWSSPVSSLVPEIPNRRMRILEELVSAAVLVRHRLREEERNNPLFRFPVGLLIKDDCYVLTKNRNGYNERRITYSVIDNTGEPYPSALLEEVRETNVVLRGRLGSSNSSWEEFGRDSTFTDNYNAGLFGTIEQIQSYAAFVRAPGIPVSVLPLWIGFPGVYGQHISMTRSSVVINGSDGGIDDGTYRKCN